MDTDTFSEYHQRVISIELLDQFVKHLKWVCIRLYSTWPVQRFSVCCTKGKNRHLNTIKLKSKIELTRLEPKTKGIYLTNIDSISLKNPLFTTPYILRSNNHFFKFWTLFELVPCAVSDIPSCLILHVNLKIFYIIIN